MNKYIDIPKEQILPMLEQGLKDQLQEAGIEETTGFKVDHIEWTLEGIRIWTLNETQEYG